MSNRLEQLAKEMGVKTDPYRMVHSHAFDLDGWAARNGVKGVIDLTRSIMFSMLGKPAAVFEEKAEPWIRWAMIMLDRLQATEQQCFEFAKEVAYKMVRREGFRRWLFERLSLEHRISVMHCLPGLYAWQVVTGVIFESPSYEFGAEYERIAREAEERYVPFLKESIEGIDLSPSARVKAAWVLFERGAVDLRWTTEIIGRIIRSDPIGDYVWYVLSLVERGASAGWGMINLKFDRLLKFLKREKEKALALRTAVEAVLGVCYGMWRSVEEWKDVDWDPVISLLGDDYFFKFSVERGIPPHVAATYMGRKFWWWRDRAIQEAVRWIDENRDRLDQLSTDYCLIWSEWGLPEEYARLLEEMQLLSDSVSVEGGGVEGGVSVGELTFGVEIETTVPLELVENGKVEIDEYHGGGGSISYLPGWRAEHDGSVRYDYGEEMDCEVISPVLQGKEGIERLRKAVDCLLDEGHEVNGSCGFHVHVGWNPQWPSVYMSRLVKLVYVWEDALWRITGEPCRKNGCGFARSLKGEGSQVRALQRVRETRYMMLNLTNLADESIDTVEFRLFPSVLDGDLLAAWVQICLGLVWMALGGDKIPDGGESVDDLLRYLGWIGDDREPVGLLDRENRGIYVAVLRAAEKRYESLSGWGVR